METAKLILTNEQLLEFEKEVKEKFEAYLKLFDIKEEDLKQGNILDIGCCPGFLLDT